MRLAWIGAAACVLAAAWLWLSRERATEATAGRDASTTEVSAPASRAQTASETRASREQLVASAEQLVVQVVDRTGKPRAGIGVALAWLPRGDSDPVLYDLGVTEGAEGICRVPTIRAAIERGRTAYADRMRGYGVTIHGVGLTTEVVPLDVEHLPTEVVRLVLPACGSVVARLVDATGQLVRQEMTTALEVHERGAPMVRSSTVHGELAPGPARFPVVALGARVVLHCDCRGVGSLPEQKRAGPVSDGEEVEVTWRVPDGHPILTGTIVTTESKAEPLDCMRATAVVTSMSSQASCATDDTGRFRVALDLRTCEHELVTLLLEEMHAWRPTGRCAIAKFKRTLHAGAQDLGTFTLAMLPLVVGIDVVDRAGAPVRDAEVGVGARVGNRVISSSLYADEPLWQHRTGPGRDEFHGNTTQDEFTAFVRHPEYLPQEKIPFRRGTKDLRVVLEKGGSIAVTVRADDAIEPLVQLTRSDGTRMSLAEPKQRTTPQIEFAWTGLQPGAYALAITLPEEAEPMLTLTGLQVESGKACDDPRLANLDLRSRVRRVTLTVTTAEGKPLAGEDVLVTPLTPQNRGRRFEARTDARGNRVLLLSRPSIDVLVGARDLRTRELRGLDRDTTVALARGLCVRTRLAPISVPSDLQVYCYASSVAAPWRASPGSSLHPPANTVELIFAEPGAYTLSYCVKSTQSAALLTTQRITVLDQTEPQLFEITCTAQELATALGKLGK